MSSVIHEPDPNYTGEHFVKLHIYRGQKDLAGIWLNDILSTVIVLFHLAGVLLQHDVCVSVSV